MKRLFSLSNYLQRLGGWYILLVILLAQLISIFAAVLGTISVRFNSGIDLTTLREISQFTPIFVLISNIVLLVIVWYLTPNARKRLNQWAENQLKANPKEELAAWKEITALTWRYGAVAALVTYVLHILPLSLSYYLRGFINSDQLVYSLLGGLVSVLTVTIIAVLMIDNWLAPVRLALLPNGFDAQLSGLAGAGLTSKFEVLILTLVIIGILMVGPIGFHYMTQSLTTENQALRSNFQLEAIAASIVTLILGAILGFYISRTVSIPLRDLIATFKAVEAGDLTQRANITATDEIAEVTAHFNRMVASLEELQTTLEKQVEERTRLLRATNEIAKVSSSILDPDDLLGKVINLFTDQFNYYYAAIYLLDPSEKWAELREATGEAGKVLKQNHHRHEVTGKSMVASCIRERSPRISQNTSEEKQRVDNPLLPYTRSEIALPLIAGDRVLGALNVQSTRAADFNIQVIETMQNMAGQVAIALENAHLFQEAQARLNEMRTIQQQYLREGWVNTSLHEEELEYGVGESNEANSQKLSAMISLRDQAIGEITLEGTSTWTSEQKNLIDAVAAQTAIALENARLVSESRQIAIRERMLAEINSRIWSSNTIDSVLQTAIKELGRRLDASSATIELTLDDKS
jgi:GAF domain-containing protein/HAMP domain-containing protein